MRRVLVCSLAALVITSSSAEALTRGINIGAGYQCAGTTILNKTGHSVRLSAAKQSMNGKISDLKPRITTAKNKGQTSKVTSLRQKLADAKNVRSLLKQCTDGKLNSGGNPSGPGKPGKPGRPGRK